jgi:hypothetical protein
MSDLTRAVNTILDQLTDAVKQLSEVEYTSPSQTLSGSSIGQHLRHTLEFFICLESGFGKGVVNYDKRAHDHLIETNKQVALFTIDRIRSFVNEQMHDKSMLIEVGYDLASGNNVQVETNYFRELIYNIEHAVHHMAIIKIGIREVAPRISLSPEFGVAASTIRHRAGVLHEAH